MLKFLFLLFGLIAFSCISSTQNKSEHYNDLSKGTAVCFSADEAGIVDAIIESCPRHSAGDITIISDSMTLWSNLDFSQLTSKDTFPDSLLNMLIKINETNSYIGNCILPISNDYRFINPVYKNNICDQSTSSNCFWTEFYSRFPRSQDGILSFSKIAIDSESTKALAWVMWSYGDKAADGGIASLVKENGKWKIISYTIMIVS